jgi:hypothetical protein
VDNGSLRQVLSKYFGFPSQFSFHRVLHTRLSSGAGYKRASSGGLRHSTFNHTMGDVICIYNSHLLAKYNSTLMQLKGEWILLMDIAKVYSTRHQLYIALWMALNHEALNCIQRFLLYCFVIYEAILYVKLFYEKFKMYIKVFPLLK